MTRYVLFDALCLAAATAEEALQFACRTSTLWAPAPARCISEGELFYVDLGGPSGDVRRLTARDCIELVEPWLSMVERVAPDVVTPQVVCFPRLGPACVSELRQRFACELRFDEPALRVAFRATDLRQTNPYADEALASILIRCAEERLGLLSQRWGTASRVRRHLATVADPSATSAESVAAQFGISVRTLHRRLHSEQTSYRRIMKELRLDQCRAHLSVAARSAKEVAFTLGFGSAASFHRAFRRWTGCTVGEYRRKELATSASEREVVPLLGR